MSRLSMKKLNMLLSDSKFAAGNFLRKVIAISDNVNHPIIYLDEPYVSIAGKKYLTMSLFEMKLLSEEYASFYFEQGITAKDVVGIYANDGIDYLIQYLALTSLGAVAAFVNGGLDSELAALYLNQLQPSGIFTTECRADALKANLTRYSATTPCWIKGLLNSPRGRFPEVYPFVHSELDPVLLTHTSGTTGIPKAVQSSHFPYLHGVKDRLSRHVPHLTRFFNTLPHAHSSSIGYIMEATIRGCPIKIQTCKDPQSLAKAIESFKPDYVLSFPNLYVDMCRLDLNQYDFSSVFFWRSTGDAAHEKHIHMLTRHGSYEKYDGTIGQGSIYIDGMGSTEMGSALFTTYRSSGMRDFNRNVGQCAEYVDAQILDDNGRKLGPHVVGFLAVKSPSVIQGYWNNTNKTEKSRIGGYWVTGDLAYKDDEGNFYHVDRVTDRINTNEGMLYSLLAEEFILKKFDEIYDCSIFRTVGENGFEKATLKAEILKGSLSDAEKHDLLMRVNGWLHENNIPRIHYFDVSRGQECHAPLGVTGKVLKRVLRDEVLLHDKVA